MPVPARGRPKPPLFAFGIRAAGNVYGFVAEIDQVKLARSGLSDREIAQQARDHAVESMFARRHDPERIRASGPRRLEWEADSARFRYCQHFDFGPNGGSILYLNRPPPGEVDQLAEFAFAAETPADNAE